jgi:hypothetical protein
MAYRCLVVLLMYNVYINRRTKEPVDNSRGPYNNDQLSVIYNASSTRYINLTYADVGRENDIFFSRQSGLPTYEEATLGIYEEISDQTCRIDNDRNDKKVKKDLRETDI